MIWSRSARAAAATAGATLAAVIDPAARGDSGKSLSPISKRTWSTGTPSISAATWLMTV